jgi:hypothetical protein
MNTEQIPEKGQVLQAIDNLIIETIKRDGQTVYSLASIRSVFPGMQEVAK